MLSHHLRLACAYRTAAVAVAVGVAVLAAAGGCKDISRFSTAKDECYFGSVVVAPFVRTGFMPGVRMRMTLDTERLSRDPGEISTSDDLFQSAKMRPIPELTHDPLSTLQFGEGRTKNLIFGLEPSHGPTALTVISLLDNEDTEVRIVRGAPFSGSQVAIPVDGESIFGVFPLTRIKGKCEF